MVYKRLLPFWLVVSLIVVVLPGTALARQSNAFSVPPGRLVVGDDKGLFTILADGSDKTYLVEEDETGCWLRDGAWSPDGTKIMYTAICGGSSPYDWRPDPGRTDLRERTAKVMVYDLADGSSSELVPSDGVHQDYAGDWNPDGKEVVIYSDRDPSAIFNFYTFDLASGSLTQLTTFDSNASRVSYDPSGRYLLYNRHIIETNQFEVRALDLSNKAEITVAVGLTPNWSPDGKWITYATEVETSDVFVMPADCIYQGGDCNAERDARNVTYTPDIAEREPVFSPDQTQIVYARNTNPNPGAITWDIYRQDLLTGLLQNLTNTPETEERQRSWERIEVSSRADVASVLPVVARVFTSEGVANLRADPTTTADIVGQVSTGQMLFVQGATANRSWYRITLPADGSQAWIFGNLITAVQGDLADVPEAQ
jgi:Tol biopolymer transport system component